MSNGMNNETDLKKSIVSKIISIFEDVPPQKDIMIFANDVFAETRDHLEEIAKMARTTYYEDIFDKRLERLRTVGCPEFILRKLIMKKGEVVSNACALNMVDDSVSLIPVIPSCYLTIYSQLEMINFSGVKGDTALESTCIINALKNNISRDEGKIFDDLYFMLDIDYGVNTENLTCAEACEKIRGKDRSPLTVQEIIAILLQQTDPPFCNLLAGGSRYEQGDSIPFYTTEADKPLLKTCFYNTLHPNSITPSCRARV